MPKTNRRQHGEGSIYQRSDGRWVYELHLGYRPDGKPDRRYVYGKSVDDVMAKKQKLEAQLNDGYVPPKGKGDTVATWMTHWLYNIARSEIRESTWNRSYRSKVEKHIIPGLGRIRLRDLTEQHVEEFEAQLKKDGLAAASIIQIHRILSRALKIAVMRRLIPRNPCQFVSPPSSERAEPLPPERDEVSTILAAVADRRNGVRWALALAAGPRQGEALGLMWPCLNLDDLDHATMKIAWEVVRLPWQHGCEDPHACGAKYHRYPCPADPRDCRKAQRVSGKRHTCRRPCPPKCLEHDEGDCPSFCDPGCARHASRCPKRHGGGLRLTEPKSKKSRRTVSLPRPVAEMLAVHRTRQAVERPPRPLWQGWKHECDRRPKARELVCPKCRLPVRDDLLVFSQPDGSPIDSRRDWQEWADLLEELGLPHYRPHDGRHFTATTALEEGVDVIVVQEMLGHATAAFTQETYQHVRPRLQRDAADKIGGALFGDRKADRVERADGRE